MEREARETASYGRVAKNVLDNFAQSVEQLGMTVHPRAMDRLVRLSRAELSRRRELIAARARLAVDSHGDLRLEHVYLGEDGEIDIIDCVEFNDDFRFSDPIADLAFLSMDLRFRWHDHAADALELIAIKRKI